MKGNGYKHDTKTIVKPADKNKGKKGDNIKDYNFLQVPKEDIKNFSAQK
jgi:hypothetical protein